jgi:hypothetical protein
MVLLFSDVQLCRCLQIVLSGDEECEQDNNRCTVGTCKGGECVESEAPCNLQAGKDATCNMAMCTQEDGCTTVAKPNSPEITCVNGPAPPQCKKQVCFDGQCMLKNAGGACSSNPNSACKLGVCDYGSCMDGSDKPCEVEAGKDATCNMATCTQAYGCTTVAKPNSPEITCGTGPVPDCKKRVCFDGQCTLKNAGGACSSNTNLCKEGICQSGQCNNGNNKCNLPINVDSRCTQITCSPQGICGTTFKPGSCTGGPPCSYGFSRQCQRIDDTKGICGMSSLFPSLEKQHILLQAPERVSRVHVALACLSVSSPQHCSGQASDRWCIVLREHCWCTYPRT